MRRDQDDQHFLFQEGDIEEDANHKSKRSRGEAGGSGNMGEQMPSVAEVCESFGLNDVAIEYSESDFQTLTSYKAFQQHVRPLLAKENLRVPVSKLMMLVAAKWREFSNLTDQHNEEEDDDAQDPHDEDYDDHQEHVSRDEDLNFKGTRKTVSNFLPVQHSKRSRHKKMEEIDEDFDDDDGVKKKRGRKRGEKQKKGKVPTLKIKLGKRKKETSVSYFPCNLGCIFNGTILRTTRVKTALLNSNKCWLKPRI